MQEIISWIIFILIICGIYLVPKYNTIRKHRKKQKEQVETLLGVVPPKKDRDK